MVSCTDDDDKDPNFMPPDIVMGGGDVESEYPEDLPVPGASVVYAPSLMPICIALSVSSIPVLILPYPVGQRGIHVLLLIWMDINRLLRH